MKQACSAFYHILLLSSDKYKLNLCQCNAKSPLFCANNRMIPGNYAWISGGSIYLLEEAWNMWKDGKLRKTSINKCKLSKAFQSKSLNIFAFLAKTKDQPNVRCLPQSCSYNHGYTMWLVLTKRLKIPKTLLRLSFMQLNMLGLSVLPMHFYRVRLREICIHPKFLQGNLVDMREEIFLQGAATSQAHFMIYQQKMFP